MKYEQLDGIYSKEPEIGQDDYHLFQLTNSNLKQLAELIRGMSESTSPLSVYIGQGCIHFHIATHSSFNAKLLSDGCVSVQADQSSLNNLARRLEDMAQAEVDPDNLVHTHLDNDFSSPPKGLSDIVFQRLDEFHAG